MIAPGTFNVVRALFRIDLLLKDEIDCSDDQVGNDVKGSNTQENVGVVKWHLFRHLHHAENNHQIGAEEDMALAVFFSGMQASNRIRGLRNDLLTFAGSTP